MKFLMFLVSFAFTATSAMADTGGSPILGQFGFVGGVNMAGGSRKDTLSESTEDFDRKFGFNIGLRLYNRVSEWGFRTGVQVSQYNFLWKNPFLVGSGASDRDACYSSLQLTVPLTAEFSVNEDFSLFGGAGVSIHLDEDLEGDEFEGVDTENESLWVTLQLGASLVLSPKFKAEFVFDYGVTDFIVDSEFNILAVNFVYML